MELTETDILLRPKMWPRKQGTEFMMEVEVHIGNDKETLQVEGKTEAACKLEMLGKVRTHLELVFDDKAKKVVKRGNHTHSLGEVPTKVALGAYLSR